MARSCKMAFTLFKVDTDWEKIYLEFKEVIRYLIVNLEQCPDTGRKHWQGYIQFFKACRFAKFHKIVGVKCHMEIQRGTTEDNMKYCSKLKTGLGKCLEFGKPTSQGLRNDLIAVKHMIDDGVKMYEVAQEHFGNYVRYHRGLEKYKGMFDKNQSSKRRDVKTTLLYGKTGTGKTKFVLDKYGDDNVFIMSFSNKAEWWDGYEGEHIILFDDYNNNFKIDRLLRLLDVYKCRLPVKCGFTWAKWHEVYITTNLLPEEIHENAKTEHRSALFRRIDNVVDCSTCNFINIGNGTKCLGNTNQTHLIDEGI